MPNSFRPATAAVRLYNGDVAASLVNLLGFTTGAVLYGMLLWMAMRSRSDRLSVLTGALGLVWNVGAFSGYGLYTIGLFGPSPILMAIAFAALGFLPAIVAHSVLRTAGSASSPFGRFVLPAAYALSAAAGPCIFGRASSHMSPPPRRPF